MRPFFKKFAVFVLIADEPELLLPLQVQEERVALAEPLAKIRFRVQLEIDLPFELSFKPIERPDQKILVRGSNNKDVDIREIILTALGIRPENEREANPVGFAENFLYASSDPDSFEDDAFELLIKSVVLIHHEESGVGLVFAEQDTLLFQAVESPLKTARPFGEGPPELLDIELSFRVGEEKPEKLSLVYCELEHDLYAN